MIISSTSLLFESESLTSIAAFLLTSDCAFLYWWFSATFGDGTRITGLPTTHNSEIAIAPALETIISAAWYANSIFLINVWVVIPLTFKSLTSFTAKSEYDSPVCQIIFKLFSLNFSKPFAIVSLIVFAPKLPPITNIVLNSLFKLNNLFISCLITYHML